MSDLPDMENRDPNDINDHVKVAFEDVLAEPKGVRSIDCTWKCAYCCFTCTLNCCYRVFTILCGVPIAFCWACEFAYMACYHIWFLTPYIRCHMINLYMVRKIMQACLDACIGPCCETCGMFFSKVTVTNK